MLHSNILNTDLISLLSRLGHTQSICICDAGLPIPRDIPCIDLALTQNVPDIVSVLKLIGSNLVIESAVAASECRDRNPIFTEYLLGASYPVDYITHDEFKKRSLQCISFVRTGECSPYANLILNAGVSF